MRLINFFFKLSFLASALYLSAQTIPVEKWHSDYMQPDIPIPANHSVLDVNNVFDRYTGDWKFTDNASNRVYTLRITKTVRSFTYGTGSYEILNLTYKIEDINGNAIEDYICDGGICAAPNGKIMSGFLKGVNEYFAGFNEIGSCDRLGNIKLSSLENGNRLEFIIELRPRVGKEDEHTLDKCADGTTPYPLPVGGKVFERVE